MTARIGQDRRSRIVRKYADVLDLRNERFVRLCTLARDALGGSTTAIALLDDRKSWLAAWQGRYSPEWPREHSLSLDVVTRAQTICIPDVAGLEDGDLAQRMAGNDMRAYAAAPLLVEHGVCIGSFFVAFDSPHEFDARSLKVLEGFCRIAVDLMHVSLLKIERQKSLIKLRKTSRRLKDQQRRLVRSEQMQMHAEHMAGIGGWEIDFDAGKSYYSDQACAILELAQGSILDIDESRQFWRAEAHDAVRRFFQRARDQAEGFEFTLPLTTSKGNGRLVRCLGEPEVAGGRVVRLFGALQDVTELRAAEKRAMQMQRMDAVGKMAGGIAHDFNNLLSIILGNLQVSLRTLPGEYYERENIQSAISAARRGAKLTERLLTFSVAKDTTLAPIAPSAVVSGLADLLRNAVGARQHLVLDVDDEGWQAHSDASQLETAILNLVVNARDASSDGGRIRVAVECLGRSEMSSLTLPGLAFGDYVRISVTDWGSGIPKEVIDRVQEPFFTTKDVGKGTGLGLSMVHGFVARSKGCLVIDSNEGRGTIVSLYLPRLVVRADDGRKAGGESYRILVVDDEDDLRNVAIRMLKDLGHLAIGVSHAQAALQYLDNGNAVDILVSDIRMPGGMNGMDLAEKAQAEHPNLKVVLMTGFSGSRDIANYVGNWGFRLV